MSAKIMNKPSNNAKTSEIAQALFLAIFVITSEIIFTIIPSNNNYVLF